MMRRFPVFLLIALLVPFTALLLRGWILAEWRFDTFSLAHWEYLARVMGRWWNTGQGPKFTFLAALACFCATPPITGFILWRLRERVAALLLAILKPLLAIAGLLWRHLLRPLLRVAGLAMLRIAERAAERPTIERQPPPGLKPVFTPQTPSRSAAPQVPAAPGADAASTSAAQPAATARKQAEAGQPEARNESSSETTSGLVFSAPTDEEFAVAEHETAAADATVAYASAQDIRQEAALWLHARQWEILHDLPVDGSLEGRFVAETDPFDNDPRAVIPMVALSGTEIRLIFPINLEGAVWAAAIWSPERGNAEWTAEHDQTVTMRCPVGEAMRATARFAAAFEAGLSSVGMSVAQVYPALILANGDVGNWADLVDSWPDGSIAHLERPGALDYAFGGDPVEDSVDPLLVQYLRSAGREAVARRKSAA